MKNFNTFRHCEVRSNLFDSTLNISEIAALSLAMTVNE